MDSKDVVNNFISSQIFTNHQGLTQAENVDKSLKKVVDNLYAGKQETDAQLATIGSKVGEIDDIDWALADESGNVPMQIVSGELQTQKFNSATTPKIDTISSYDFALADESGNVAFAIIGGRILTKIFDSSSIPTGGLDTETKNKIKTILNKAVYTEDTTSLINNL